MILIKHKYYFKKKNRDLLWIKYPADISNDVCDSNSSKHYIPTTK